MSRRRSRTRVKFCGLTRLEDVDAAVNAGADAVGFVLYPKSPRCISLATLSKLVARVPPFVATLALVVNKPRLEIEELVREVRLSALQFHGDESPDDCAGFGVPWLRAARMHPTLDLLQFKMRYHGASALLLDALAEGYGGGGKSFDWSLIPKEIAPQVVLSGGLNAKNVAEALARVHPYAVDVSSGIERAPGIKDPKRMREFIDAVRRADDLFLDDQAP